MTMNSTLHGGKRVGAGRKKKSNIEKIENGNPGGRKLTEIDIGEDLEAVDMPPIKEYLYAPQRDGTTFAAKELFEETYKWLVRVKCADLVPTHLIEQYAISQARYIQCAEAVTKYGLIAKHPTTGGPIQSPYVNMASNFMKQSTCAWNQIYQIVKENSSVDFRYNNPRDDVMESLLNGTWWKEHGGRRR